MTLHKTVVAGFLSAMVGSLALGATAQEGEVSAEEFDIAAITCWDVMTLEEGERTSALLLIYGYNAGSNKTTVMSGASIEADLSRVMNFCADNPDTSALEALGQ